MRSQPLTARQVVVLTILTGCTLVGLVCLLLVTAYILTGRC